MIHITGRPPGRLADADKGAEYNEFEYPRRPEQYVGQLGPHDGNALPHGVLDAIAKAKVTGRPHEYLVRGEWIRRDGVRFLDIAIDRAWLTANSDYQLVNGMLRWVCPGCGRLSGAHVKGCEYR